MRVGNVLIMSGFQAIYELYQGEIDIVEDLNNVKKVSILPSSFEWLFLMNVDEQMKTGCWLIG